MFFYYLKNLLRGVVLNAVLIIPVAIVSALFADCGRLAVMIIIAVLTVIISVVFFIICFSGEGVIGQLFLGIEKRRFISEYDIDKYECNEKYAICSDKQLVRRAAIGKPILAIPAYIILLLHLATAIFFAYILFYLPSDFMENDQSAYEVISGILVASAIWQFEFFVTKLVYYTKCTCFKCGRIFSIIEANCVSDSFAGEYQKTRTTSEKVGSISYKGKNIGVYRDVDYTDTYGYYGGKYEYSCTCMCCGKRYKQKIKEYTSYRK